QLVVTFGALDAGPGPLEQKVTVAPPLFDASARVSVELDQSSPEIYGSHGFRIAIQSINVTNPSFSVDQSLAQLQDMSYPQTVPTSYFLTQSSYVLLL